MRIGIDLENINREMDYSPRTTNYSKAEKSSSIKIDITNVGMDTVFSDQGRSFEDVMEMAGALDVQTTRDYMTVMSNTMSPEDYKKICEEGYDPKNMTGEESANILDHIKAVMAESGQIVAGYNDNLSVAKLESITGNQADAAKLERAMKEADLSINEENAKSIYNAAKEIEDVKELSDASIKYMIENGMKPTIDNIYLSKYSAIGDGSSQPKGYYNLGMQGYLGKKAEPADIEKLLPEIEKTVEKMQIEDITIETQFEEARWLVEKGLPVNKENIIRLDELKNLKLPLSYEAALKAASIAVADGKNARKAIIDPEAKTVYEEAADLIKKVADIKESAISVTVSKHQTINIQNLYNNNRFEATSDSNISAYRNLEEIRLRMTLDVNVSLLRKGISIDTMPLTELVEKLKVEEANVQAKYLGEGTDQELNVKASIYSDTTKILKDIPSLPAATIGRLRLEEQISLTRVHEVGTELRAQYEKAGNKYETLMTAPRADMGDSIQKAFRNVDAILEDLGIERTPENQKAVRILGYNNIEINVAEIENVKTAMAKVQDVVNGLTPAKTLELIRQGINPLDMDLEDLSREIKKLETPEETGEKYSKFLYRLEKNNEISEAEKYSYIGIYRFINRLEKTDGAAIGALLKSNSNITFGSLLSGMRSKNAKFNLKIDDNFGLLQQKIEKGISISDQIERGYVDKQTQQYIDRINEEYMMEEYTSFKNQLNQISDISPDEIIANQYAETLLTGDENAFGKMRSYSKKYSDVLDTDEKLEEKLMEKIDSFYDKFDSENAKPEYTSLIEEMQNILSDMIEYGADSSTDIKDLMMCSRQLHMAGNYAKSEKYYVPYMTEDGFATINLTIRHDDFEKGTVTARLQTHDYGEVIAQFKQERNGIDGIISVEYSSGTEAMLQVANHMQQTIENISNVNVVVGKLNTDSTSLKDLNKDVDNNSVNTQELYNIAKTFIKAFINA